MSTFNTPGVGPTTGDQRLNSTPASQYQVFLDTFLNEDPQGQMALPAMAGMAKLKQGSNEAITFTKRLVMGDASSLSAQRQAATGNHLTSDPTKGGAIASKAVGLIFETFKLQEVYTYATEFSEDKSIDDAVLPPMDQARLNADAYIQSWMVVKHQEILSNMILADRWLGDKSKNSSTLAEAVTEGATTFKVPEAFAANLYVGCFVKIANYIDREDAAGAAPAYSVIMVKALAAAAGGTVVVTIEDDSANFPIGFEQDGVTQGFGKIFKKLHTELGTHVLGVKIETDYPVVITEDNADAEWARPLKLAGSKAKMTMSNRTVYTTLELVDAATGDKNQIVLNDFLGKDILTDGDIGRFRGMQVVAEDIAAKRILGDNTIHYSWLLQKGETVFFKELKRNRAIGEKIQERAGMLMKDTYFDVYGSHCPRSGRVRSVLHSAVLEAFTAPS